MSPALEECEQHALKLPPRERATLAERLIASLDVLSDAQNEELWLDEAEQRYQAYKDGKLAARGAESVLHEARAALR